MISAKVEFPMRGGMKRRSDAIWGFTRCNDQLKRLAVVCLGALGFHCNVGYRSRLEKKTF